MTIENRFGQTLEVGTVVGWGHRDGNMSRQQVGVVLSLTPFETRRGFQDAVRHKAKCVWVDQREYTSTTEAEDLFVLDPWSLSVELQAATVAAKLKSLA